jgi:tetratricopeptide (TPR) repeat protein
LGVALAQENRIEDAVPHFQKAVEIAPQDPIGNFNLAAYAQQKGDLQNAVQRYQAMLQMNSDARLRSDAYNNLGSVYRALGDYAHARENYRASLELVPNNPAVLVQMGVLAQKTRDFDEAIADYSRAMAIQPTDVGYLLQAQAFKQSGRAAEAEAARKQAESLSRDLAHAQQEADSLLAR